MINNLKNIALQSECVSYHTNQLGAGGFLLGENKMILRICPICGDKKKIHNYRARKPSYTGLCKKCFMLTIKGENSYSWKGGRIVDVGGYGLIKDIEHPLAGVRGYVLEHRLVAANEWGVEAVRDMDVHHKDGNKQNNSIENLELMTRSEHTAKTWKDRRENDDEFA